MTDKKVLLRKILTIAAVGSFPVGVLMLGAPDSWFKGHSFFASEQGQVTNAFMQESMVKEALGIKQLDVDILRARGEVLKLKEKREEKLQQLQTFQGQISKMIQELSASQFGEVEMAKGLDSTSIDDQRKSR